VLGPTRTLLSDAEPMRIGANFNHETTPSLLETLEQRWTALRDELSVFAAEDDDPEVTEAAAALEVAVSSLLNRLAWYVAGLLHRRTQPLDMYKLAGLHWAASEALLRIVLDLVRGRDVSEVRETLAEVRESLREVSSGAASTNDGS
jgi:hypothetical protein